METLGFKPHMLTNVEVLLSLRTSPVSNFLRIIVFFFFSTSLNMKWETVECAHRANKSDRITDVSMLSSLKRVDEMRDSSNEPVLSFTCKPLLDWRLRLDGGKMKSCSLCLHAGGAWKASEAFSMNSTGFGSPDVQRHVFQNNLSTKSLELRSPRTRLCLIFDWATQKTFEPSKKTF